MKHRHGFVELLALFCLMTVTTMTAIPKVNYDSNGVTGVELIPGSSDQVSSILQEVTDSAALSVIRPLLPYCVFVHNVSPNRLLMINIRLTRVEPAGGVTYHDISFGTRSRYPQNMIPPGSMVLVTPVAGLSVVIPRSGPLYIPDLSRLKNVLAGAVSRHSSLLSLKIDLDSIIYEDGRVVGPDRARTTEKLNTRAAAEREVISGVKGKRGDEISAYLNSVQQEGQSAVKTSDASLVGSLSHDLLQSRREIAAGLMQQRSSFPSDYDFLYFLDQLIENRVALFWRSSQ